MFLKTNKIREMIAEFKNLSEKEINLLMNAPTLITLLIAGAEGNIEEKETDWGAKITHFRGENKESTLQSYYKEVDSCFNETLKELVSALPENVDERTAATLSELQKLNDILPKLSQNFSKELYKSYVTLAKHIAQASGGIWGYGAISPEEQKLIDLDIIKSPDNTV